MTQDIRLPGAPFWSASQAAFLREFLGQISDWAGLVDQSNKALREPPKPPQ